ncbi:MAG: hypothetical protein ACXWUS_08125, partial [Burkholderiales bacterium]
MAAVPNASVVFLPWVRQGAAAAIDTPDTLNANLRGAVDLTATLTINSAQGVPVTVRLRGPADVVGVDQHEIVRMDPKPNTADFEPNYFPAVEFDRPDFPWLFTPAKAAADAKLRPWLCLVVVRKQDGVILSSTADAPLPVLNITAPAKPSEELPDLTESWAWVHAQVASSSMETPGELRTALRTRPERSLSRLLCPRVLQPNTDYIACVVPTFELGRKAGLGQEIKDTEITAANGLKPAWSLTPAPLTVTLPVYHQWQFRTGEGGDFESLVRLLRATPAPEGLGKRAMDISRPGFTLPSSFPADARLALEGALRAVESKDLAQWPDGAAEPFQTELAKIVNEAGLAQTRDPHSDPLLAPPLYGQWHAARSPSTVTRGATPWFDELNLDPRHRSVAAFGTRVVQENQEALMAAAWEQAGDLERANQRMRQLQLSLAASTSLYTRHFSRLRDDAVLRVSAPVLARVRAGSIGALETTTMASKLSSTALPLQAVSTAMRRIARDRGPITRRIAAQGVVRSATPPWLVALNSSTALTFTTPSLPDLATFGVVRERSAQSTALSAFRDVTDAAIANMRGRPVFRITPEGQPVFTSGVANLPPTADNPTSHNFRVAAQAHLARVNPARMGIIFAPPPAMALKAVRDSVIAQIEPRRTLVPLAQAVIAMGANTTATAPTNTGIVPIEPIMAAPKFPQPMYESLRDLSQQLLLPGLETVEPNSVLGLETNARFVEAYMVGLNFEMGRELLWRGYPTDQRGTYFERFWDARASSADADVFPLHTWGERPLGDPQTAPSGDRFVMLIRSALLRRYPTAVIYAAKALIVRGVRKPSGKPEDEKHPAVRGSMQPDVSFFGFDLTVAQAVGPENPPLTSEDQGYFIVIQEQPTEPRFGLDVGTPTAEGTHL